MSEYDLNNKKILITGAAGGIGSAAALLFAKKGAIPVLVGHSNMEALEKLSYEIVSRYGITPFVYSCELSDTLEISRIADKVLSDCGHIDILVNNAAVSIFGLAQDLSDAEWARISSVNLTAPVMLSRAFIPSFIKRGSGRIINISSMWGRVGASCESAYSATKGGIESFTKALAKELAPSHIPVNAIAFGAVDTKMNGRLSPEEKAEFEESIPYGRMATPEEAAEMILTVASAPDYMTGQVIGFDGGFI
ncbi:MAG: SDR family oxidoreductase [Lachnospiraceae bacterium]|nr:SDR family oxidoreductase [Lachnospiraceae bacterium]